MPEPVLFYVRHGETEWNRQGRLQGQHDSALTALGRAQAARSGEIVRELLSRDGRPLDTVDYIASPLGRARATMEQMRATLDLDVDDYRTDARLKELSFGRWEGLAYPQLLACERDVLAARERDKWNFVPPGGESYADLTARVRAWCAGLVRDSVVVAHGGTGRALVALKRLAEPEKAAVFDVDQGVVYVFAARQLARYG
jgi:probable phosphoglycerate mutase